MATDFPLHEGESKVDKYVGVGLKSNQYLESKGKKMAGNLAFVVLSLWLIAAAQLAGCGQKGPLYLPPPQQDHTQEKR